MAGFCPQRSCQSASNVSIRWSRSKIYRIKKNGGSCDVPPYCHNPIDFRDVEREIEERKLVGPYEKALNDVLGISGGKHGTWNASTMTPSDKASALLVMLGHPILTHDMEDAKRYPQLRFKQI